jgi:hypothetical protein
MCRLIASAVEWVERTRDWLADRSVAVVAGDFGAAIGCLMKGQLSGAG